MLSTHVNPYSGAEAAARARSSTRSTLSQRVLDLTWEPLDLGGAVAIPDDHERALAFVARHYDAIFKNGANRDRFLEEPPTPAKQRFLAEMDVFTFEAEGRIVGVSMSHPTDWSTYYFRSFALLPEAQARGIPGKFMRATCARLREAGVVRAEAECLPTNLPMQRTLAAGGFVVTGSVASERWGFLLRLTKFLVDDARERFEDTYSPMPTTTINQRRTS